MFATVDQFGSAWFQFGKVLEGQHKRAREHVIPSLIVGSMWREFRRERESVVAKVLASGGSVNVGAKTSLRLIPRSHFDVGGSE